MSIAEKESDWNVREVAIDKIGFENIFNDETYCIEDAQIRIKAVRKINNQDALIYIARNDNASMIRAEAVGKINDPKILEEIYRKESESHIRQAAIHRANKLNGIT